MDKGGGSTRGVSVAERDVCAWSSGEVLLYSGNNLGWNGQLRSSLAFERSWAEQRTAVRDTFEHDCLVFSSVRPHFLFGT